MTENCRCEPDLYFADLGCIAEAYILRQCPMMSGLTEAAYHACPNSKCRIRAMLEAEKVTKSVTKE